MLKKSVSEGGDIEFDIFIKFKKNIESIIIIFVMLLTLIVTMIYEIKVKMAFNKTIAKVLLFIYISFLIVATICELTIGFEDE